ncbi:hypothetical protein BCEN4_1800020 [Burkholderia cenocepacia]|nr:hypothetical protein BCEN4_1800020 [Burkholderia cenocepacia]
MMQSNATSGETDDERDGAQCHGWTLGCPARAGWLPTFKQAPCKARKTHAPRGRTRPPHHRGAPSTHHFRAHAPTA